MWNQSCNDKKIKVLCVQKTQCILRKNGRIKTKLIELEFT